jgi:hypothetical protein
LLTFLSSQCARIDDNLLKQALAFPAV